jgi:flagellar biosynthetic protein FliP
MSAALGALAALALTSGLLVLALRLLRLWNPGAAERGAVPLAVLQRVAVGPRQHVGLLRVGERVLVVSLAEAGVTLLGELDGETRAAALERARTAPRVASRLRALLPMVCIVLLAFPSGATAQSVQPPRSPVTSPIIAPRRPVAPTAPRIDVQLGSEQGGLRLQGAVGIVVLLTVLSLLPTLFLLMTSFTRILVVLHFLRMGLGTQNAPPTQLLIAMAVLLTGVVMQPTLREANRDALQPYLEGRLDQTAAYQAALVPFRRFMIANAREQDLAAFAEMTDADSMAKLEDLPIVTVASAFVTSELKTAFQIGFVIFLPFVVIDLIVASVLVSMGMFMLPPAVVSLPFKLLLFVLADGWTLIVRSLVAGFHSG